MSKEAPLTAAQLLRASMAGRPATTTTQREASSSEPTDLDEEIKRLEAELQGDDDSSSDTGDSESEGGSSVESDSGKNDKSSCKPAVLSLSTVKEERIESLPISALPSNKRRLMKIDREEGADPLKEKKAKKKKASEKEAVVSDGLRAAVKEVLSGYQARSAERIPFYCRVCSKQYETEEDFFQHKSTEFHQAAVEMEKKLSYCRLCRKQLTSPVQLQEHLKSRPHKDRLEKTRKGQQRQRRPQQGSREQGSQRQWK